MAENESLDLGTAQRWDAGLAALKEGLPCSEVASKLRKPLYDEVREARRQFRRHDVTLSDLVGARNSPPRLRQLVRQTGSDPRAQLFESSAHASGPAAEDCLQNWVYAMLDNVLDRIILGAPKTDDSRTFLELKELTDKVREILAADVEHMAAQLAKNADGRLQRKRGQAKADDPANPTEELMGMSLLGGKQL